MGPYRHGPPPVPLKRETTLTRQIRNSFSPHEEQLDLAGFCEKHQLEHPAGPRKFILRPASPQEAGLFYSQLEPEWDVEEATVGHLRIDFASGYDLKQQKMSMEEKPSGLTIGGCKMAGEIQAPISRKDFQEWAGAAYRLYENIRQADGSVLGCTRHVLIPEVNVLFVGSPENPHATMDLCGLYDKRLGEFRFITKELAAIVDGLSKQELWNRSIQGPNLLQNKEEIEMRSKQRAAFTPANL